MWKGWAREEEPPDTTEMGCRGVEEVGNKLREDGLFKGNIVL